jgi:uncharacterized membrane protein
VVALSAPIDVYLFTLLTTVLWGIEPIVSKRGMAGGGTTVQATLVVIVVDMLLFWGALVWRYGLDPLAGLPIAVLGLFALGGLVGTALGRLAVFAGIDRVGASLNSAVVSSRPVFAAFMAVGFLGESVSLLTGTGIGVLVGGLITLSLARGGDLDGWQPRELLFPLAAAVFFAAGNVIRRFGLQTTEATALQAVALNETAAFVALAAYIVASGSAGEVRSAPARTYGLFAVSGTLTAVALLSLFTAFSLPGGRVVIVDPIVAAAPLVTVALAALLLRDLERVTPRVAAGAVMVVVGAALVTVG